MQVSLLRFSKPPHSLKSKRSFSSVFKNAYQIRSQVIYIVHKYANIKVKSKVNIFLVILVVIPEAQSHRPAILFYEN